MTVFKNGAFIEPINEHGVRLMERQHWMQDGDGPWRLTEVNGDPLF
jgi:hypothetical protein